VNDDNETPDPVELTWRLNASDISSTILTAFGASPGMASIPIAGFLAGATGLAVSALRRGNPTALIGVLLFFGLGCLLVAQAIPRLALRKIPEEARTLRLLVSSRGITVAQHSSQAQTAWTGIAKLRRVRGGYALHLRSGGLQYIPDRAISEAQRSQLLTWMARERVEVA